MSTAPQPASPSTSTRADGPEGVRTFPHTVIEEVYGGRGLATLLIRTALDATRVADLSVLPQCSAVRHFISENPDYVDLVPAERRAEFGF